MLRHDKDLNSDYIDESDDTTLDVATSMLEEAGKVAKGGAGSGSWEGPGQPRFAHTPAQASDRAVNTAKEYTKSAGLPVYTPHEPVNVDPERGSRIAEAYEQMKNAPEDPDVKAAYGALGKEVEDQFKLLPVEVEFTKDDPYSSSKAMMEDVTNNRLRVYTGGEPHPLLGAKDKDGISLNDKFRAVHDYFGHSMRGNQFGPSGEENAWIDHSGMFSPLAQKAMTTETRGQNSWFNYSKTNEGKEPKDRSFAEQKVGILPDEFLPSARRKRADDDKTVQEDENPRQCPLRAYLFKDVQKGGAGSGNFGHEGRPGQVGGSGEGGATTGNSNTINQGQLDLERYQSIGNVERLMLFDAETGKNLLDIKGAEHSVDRAAYAEGKLFLDNKVVEMHTHPNKTSFSDGDWKSFAWSNVVESRVIAEDNVFILRKGEEWNARPWQEHTPRKIEERFREIEDEKTALGTDWNVDTVLNSVNKQMAKEFGATFIIQPRNKVTKGGPGSGHFGHAGRPGQVGGSGEGGGKPDIGSDRPETPIPSSLKTFDGIKNHLSQGTKIILSAENPKGRRLSQTDNDRLSVGLKRVLQNYSDDVVMQQWHEGGNPIERSYVATVRPDSISDIRELAFNPKELNQESLIVIRNGIAETQYHDDRPKTYARVSETKEIPEAKGYYSQLGGVRYVFDFKYKERPK